MGSMAKTKVYLDIDGVLLANDLNATLHAKEFIERVVKDFDPYWLTTHCRGDAQTALDRLSTIFDPDTLKLLERFKPTNWDVAKTEAINFDEPFLWFDDDLYDDEREALIKHDALDNWIKVDLAKNPAQLADFVRSFPLPVLA